MSISTALGFDDDEIVGGGGDGCDGSLNRKIDEVQETSGARACFYSFKASLY